MEKQSTERRQIDPRPRTRSTTAKPGSASRLQEAKKKLLESPGPKRHPISGKGL